MYHHLSTSSPTFPPPPAARHYHTTLSIWLSVDPLADKYPGVSPYTYCGNNPVRLVDKDGMEISENLDKWRYNTTTGRLTWLNDEGGQFNQTVEFVHNSSDGKLHYNQTKSVNFNGTIGDMFDFSVVTPSVDKIISGTVSVVSGVIGFIGGVVLGVGGGVFTGGMATAAGTAVCFAGGSEVVMGIGTIAEAARQNRIDEQKIVRDISHSIGSYAVGKLSKPTQNEVRANLAVLAASLSWTAAQVMSALYPVYKGFPDDATIIQ